MNSMHTPDSIDRGMTKPQRLPRSAESLEELVSMLDYYSAMPDRVVYKDVLREGGVKYKLYSYTKRMAGIGEFARYPLAVYARGIVVVESRSGDRQYMVPFTKFFNAHELGITSMPPVRSYEKLDGTLIIAWLDEHTGKVRLHTKGRLWDKGNIFALGAELYIEFRGWMRILRRLVEEYHTVMFEGITGLDPTSRSHARAFADGRIGLKLLFARDRRMTLHPCDEVVIGWPGGCPERYDNTTLSDLYRMLSRDSEGFVAVYSDASRIAMERIGLGKAPIPLDGLVKVKSVTYLIKSMPFRAKARYALSKGLDDLQGAVDEEEFRVLEWIVEEWHSRIAPLLSVINCTSSAKGILGEACKGIEHFMHYMTYHGPRKPEKWRGYINRLVKRLEKEARAGGA